jgi:plasmid stability protein
MPKTIQIRNVPDELHSVLKARAAAKGKTMSEYILELAQPKPLSPEVQAFMERVRNIPREESDFDATAFIRQERDSR